MSELEKYLKTLAGNNKNKKLVDQGTGTKISLDPSVEFDGDNLNIVTRTKESTSNNTAELAMINGNLTGVYPGAIVHADSHLVDGCPNLVAGPKLKRKPVRVSLDIFGNTQDPIVIDDPSQAEVMKAINQMVQKWCKAGHTAAAQVSYKTVSIYDEKQLEVDMGIKGAGKKFKVDFKATAEGKKKEMLVLFNQVYFTARVEPQTASALYDDSVKVEDLKGGSVDEKKPLAALVTSMDFGRQIVVKLSSSNATENVEAAWRASVSGVGFSNKDKYKHIMESTSYSVFVIGGKTDTAAELVVSKGDLSGINKIIADDMNFTEKSAAFPLSYSTNFIDDASKAVVSRSTEYVKTTVAKRNAIHVKTDTANAYSTKHQKFWARPVTGIESNGKMKLGNWECLCDAGSGNQDFWIGSKYAEFGFEFDISGGTDWPYSGVFWKAGDGAASEIFIEWGGGCRSAWIDIKVDDKKVFHDGNCASHQSAFNSKS